MSKITEGPWKFSVSKNGRRQISGKSGKQVCMLWNSNETLANAALIEKAPQMLELLRDMIPLCQTSDQFNKIDEIIEHVRNASVVIGEGEADDD